MPNALGLLEHPEELARTRGRLAREQLIELAPRLRRRTILVVRQLPRGLRRALEQDPALVCTGASAAAAYGWDELTGCAPTWWLDGYLPVEAFSALQEQLNRFDIDAAIVTSFPGLGELPGARLLTEIGDDRARFAEAPGLSAHAGAAPVTRASGKMVVVLHRTVKNKRLATVGSLWTFAALRLSPGARAHYDRCRRVGDRHAAAQRNLFNRFLGCLYYCLQTCQPYDEQRAFPSPEVLAA